MYYLSNTTVHCTPLYPPLIPSSTLDLSIEPLPYGYPEDLVSVALGAGMFDCVWATHTTHFGNAIISSGVLSLPSQSPAPLLTSHAPGHLSSCGTPYPPTSHAYDSQTPDTPVGLGITRALIHYLVAKETVGAHLLTMHNVDWLLQMMDKAGEAIVKGEFPGYLKRRLQWWYPEGVYPEWALQRTFWRV